MKVVTYMKTWKPKRCPRCGGNMFIDEDLVGYYAQCLQCGYERQVRELENVQAQSAPVAASHSNSWDAS